MGKGQKSDMQVIHGDLVPTVHYSLPFIVFRLMFGFMQMSCLSQN